MSLAPLVVTAAKVPVRLDRVGISVSVLSSADLKSRHPSNAADALRNLDGAFIDEANGPGGPTIVRLRGGEEVFTQILVDGVRVNQNGGFFDFQGFAPGNLERIEVARGPQSALYGSSAVSGVVQFLTRRGAVGRPRVGLSVEGSDASEHGGGFRASADVAGGTDVVKYSGGLGWNYDRGIFDLPNDTKTQDASLRLDISPSSRFLLTGSSRWMGIDAKLPVRDPGATRVPQDPNAFNERDRLISSVAARYTPSTRFRHELRASQYREKFTYEDRRDDVAADGSYPFFIFDADFRLVSTLVRNGLEYSGTFSPVSSTGLALSWGALVEKESLDDVTSGEFGDGRQGLDRSSRAAFAEILVSPGARVDLLAGARVEKFDGLGASVTPRASAVLHIVPSLVSLRLAAGRAYKAPNLQEQYLENPFIVSNPDLSPETSTSIEAGVDVASRDGSASAALTVFRQNYDDLIRAVTFDTTGRQQNRNLGSSRAKGIEFRVEARPSSLWAIGASGTWVKTEILNATGLPTESFPTGEELPFRPDVAGTAWLETTPGAGITARLQASRVGRQTVLAERFGGPRVDIDAYSLLGLTLNYAVTPRWSVYGRFDNMLSTRYLTAYDRHGSPATAAIGIRWEN